MASMMRGDQSSRPARQASLTAEINEPVACAIFERTARGIERVPSQKRSGEDEETIVLTAVLVVRLADLDGLDKVRHADDGLEAERSLESRNLKAALDAVVEVAKEAGLLGRGARSSLALRW